MVARLIAAVTKPDDLVIDPAAGSFVVMTAANQLGRNFVGGDCEPAPRRPCTRQARENAAQGDPGQLELWGNG